MRVKGLDTVDSKALIVCIRSAITNMQIYTTLFTQIRSWFLQYFQFCALGEKKKYIYHVYVYTRLMGFWWTFKIGKHQNRMI